MPPGKYLAIERPVLSVSEICRSLAPRTPVVGLPGIRLGLTVVAWCLDIISSLLRRDLKLTSNRVRKLYADTSYDWIGPDEIDSLTYQEFTGKACMKSLNEVPVTDYKNLILVELNEINFSLVQKYVEAGHDLPGFRHLLDLPSRRTSSESSYSLLEPWIQWPSVHMGLKHSGHKIFRLGDVVASDALQIFEEVEQAGFKVGAVSPMNAVNRLSAPAYFIPDPWTDTPSDRSILVECLRARSRRRSMIIRSPDSL